MKKITLSKFVTVGALLMLGLIGNHLPQNSLAQASATLPPPNADLISTEPGNTSTANPLPPDIDPNSPLAQVVSLVQAGVEQSIIVNYINNSTGLFNLDADKIIYLNDLGVPNEVINAMMQHDQQLEQAGTPPSLAQPAATTETTAQPAEVTVNYFYNTLAPYGAWVDIEGYGWCWRPTVVVYDAGWQPYCNNGHWVYTDHGWFWVSGYSWGWATFHYGRWFHNPRYGWCWWPDTTWAPSWVCWRYDNDYCGWAPLPPHAIYRPGVGLVYDGHTVSVGFHFNLGVGAFTFVRTRDFCDRDPWHHRIESREAERIYARTRNVHQFDFDRDNQTIINHGIPTHNITAVTRQPIHPVAIHYSTGGTIRNNRHEQFEHGGSTLVVNRPHFVGSPTLSIRPRPITPTRPGGDRDNHQNTSPVFRGNQNNPPSHNFQHSDANQNRAQHFDRTIPQPQTPQVGQPVAPHVVTPPAEHNGTGVNPRQNTVTPNQNQTPRQNNNDNRWLSPRRQQFEQESPRNFRPNSFQENNRRFSTPPANPYSSPIQQQPNQNYRRVPQNNSTPPVARTEPQQRAVEPHSNYHSSSPSERHSDHQDQNNNRH